MVGALISAPGAHGGRSRVVFWTVRSIGGAISGESHCDGGTSVVGEGHTLRGVGGGQQSAC